MTEGYLREHGGTRSTEQSQPMREDQAQNPAGGYVWGDTWMQARRFLILGTERGSYYVGEQSFTREAATAMKKCIDEDGIRAVGLISEISAEGRAAKNGPALFALAMATAADNVVTRRKAWEALPKVARTGTHLLNFCAYRELFGGWGRSAKRGVGAWFNSKNPDDLGYQLVKYRQREGWSMADVLKLAHPKPRLFEHDQLYKWVTRDEAMVNQLPHVVEGFRKAQASDSPETTAQLIRDYAIPREAVKPEHLASPQVWRAFIEDENMPVMATIRNLATLSRLGVLTPLSEAEAMVVSRIADRQRMRAARVHPIALLSALRIYARGHGELSRGEGWIPSAAVVDALDAAFYDAFTEVQPSCKRTLICLDVSGSMRQPILGLNALSAREGAAAMALVTAATEPFFASLAFTGPGSVIDSETSLLPFALSGRERLDGVVTRMERMQFGRTDCALPMIYARESKLEVDTFVIYTDNETWAGAEHPAQALRRYRESSGINAKLIVVGTSATEFSIADPHDRGMLDVVGFDANAPAVMADFARGEV